MQQQITASLFLSNQLKSDQFTKVIFFFFLDDSRPDAFSLCASLVNPNSAFRSPNPVPSFFSALFYLPLVTDWRNNGNGHSVPSAGHYSPLSESGGDTQPGPLDMTSHTRTLSCPRSSGKLPEWKERFL